MPEIRKIQQVGHSTLVVTIPKKWADELELKPGLQVNLEKEADGSIRIKPEVVERRRVSKCSINADRYDAPSMLVRTLTGIYLTGTNTIRVYSKRGLKSYHLEQTRSAVQNLTGLGIIEETSNEVVVHDILDPTKFPFDNLIRHVFKIISFMQETVLKMLEEGNSDLAVEVSKLEEQMDRLYWLTVRQLLLVAKDRTVGERIGISSLSHAIGHNVIAKCLEEIADHYEDIGRTVANAIDKGLKPSNRNLRGTIKYHKHLHLMTEDILNTLLSSNALKANGLINETEALLEDMDKSSKGLLERDYSAAFTADIDSMLLNLMAVARQNRNILETTINQCLNGCRDVCEFEKLDPQPGLIEV